MKSESPIVPRVALSQQLCPPAKSGQASDSVARLQALACQQPQVLLGVLAYWMGSYSDQAAAN